MKYIKASRDNQEKDERRARLVWLGCLLFDSCFIASSAYTLVRIRRDREEYPMSGRCEVCHRKPMYGNNVSFSQRRTRRRFVLNVQHRRIEIDGVVRPVNICTRCLRSMNKLPKVR